MNQSNPLQNLNGWIQRKSKEYSQGKALVSACSCYFLALPSLHSSNFFSFGGRIACSKTLNPLTANALHRIATSQLICNANQLTGFYIMANIGR